MVLLLFAGELGVPCQLPPVAELDAAAGQAGGAAADLYPSPGLQTVAELFSPPGLPHLHPPAGHQDHDRAAKGDTFPVEGCWWWRGSAQLLACGKYSACLCNDLMVWFC